MPDTPDFHTMTPEERRAAGIAMGFEGKFLEHFVKFGGFEEIPWDDDDDEEPPSC